MRAARPLANRPAPQARDAFDIYVLWLGGHCPDDLSATIEPAARDRALDSLLALDYPQYEGQVLDYLETDARTRFAGLDRWHEIGETVFGLIEGS